MIRFAIRGLRKGVLINLIVVMQTAFILAILFSVITAIRSRYTYYEPIRDYISGDGMVCFLGHALPLDRELLENSLHGDPEVHVSYKLFHELTLYNYTVYDNDLLEHYQPPCKEGEWVLQSDDPDTVHAVVYEESGFHVGTTFTTQTDYGKKTVTVTGVLDDTTLTMNTGFGLIMAQRDFRMLYADAEKIDNKLLFLSHSEAEKLHYYPMSAGLCFIKYHAPLTEQERNENAEVLSMVGTEMRIDCEELRKNSLNYIYEQLRVLAPVVVGITVLLLISLICSNAVFANRQRRTFAIFEMLGLTRAGCLKIAAWKSLFLSLISAAAVGVFLQVKPRFPALDNYMIQFDIYQIVSAAAVIMSSMLISVLITAVTVGSNPYADSRKG